MINIDHLRNLIVEPVLKEYDYYSAAAMNLVLGTAAQETLCGYYLKQTKGPGLGIYSMEPRTHDDVWTIVILDRPFLKHKIEQEFYKFEEMQSANLVGNLWYATLMCRLQYIRFKEPLPDHSDIEGLAEYWKKYYNTVKGKGTVEDFVRNYSRYVKGKR
jgi:hypothetical protein